MQPITVTHEHVRLDGQKRIVEVVVSPLLGEDGALTGIVESCRDITERRRAEKSLRESEEYYRVLTETASDAIVTVDSESRIHFVNRATERMFGYTQAELLGQSLSMLMPDRYHQRHLDSWNRYVETRERRIAWRAVEVVGRHASGAEFSIEISFGEMSEYGEPFFTGIIRDITERKQAEEELRHTLGKLREALGGIIQTVALTVEMRDPYTAGHQRRVSNLARAIAEEMGLSEDQIDGIRMAAVIHDLGKINVPAEFLSKPSKLTDLEYGMIKMHSQAGYDILKEIDFPWPVARIVLQHHEKIDGSGYPQGLSGEEILLEARILTVADVVEAMASHRPYRPTRGLDKALEEISHNRGILYDPEVVDACLKLFTEKGFTLDQEWQNRVPE